MLRFKSSIEASSSSTQLELLQEMTEGDLWREVVVEKGVWGGDGRVELEELRGTCSIPLTAF